jgi:hypothetical protein
VRAARRRRPGVTPSSAQRAASAGRAGAGRSGRQRGPTRTPPGAGRRRRATRPHLRRGEGRPQPHPERTSQRTSRSTRAASSPGSSRVSRSATRAGWSGGVATRPTVTTPRSAPISGACPLLCVSSVIGQLPGMFRGHGEGRVPVSLPLNRLPTVAPRVHDQTGVARSASTGWCRSRAASYSAAWFAGNHALLCVSPHRRHGVGLLRPTGLHSGQQVHHPDPHDGAGDTDEPPPAAPATVGDGHPERGQVHTLPDLPYDYSAIDPQISARSWNWCLARQPPRSAC